MHPIQQMYCMSSFSCKLSIIIKKRKPTQYKNDLKFYQLRITAKPAQILYINKNNIKYFFL